MRIEQSYPSPINGVSTLAPRNRPQGYAAEQTNFRSDPVNKLTRRPSSKYVTKVFTPTDVDQVTYHSYERGNILYQYVLDEVTGDVACIVDGTVVDTLNLGSYSGSNMEMFSVEHDTYILNRDVEVELLNDTDASTVRKVCHINVTSALNYSETVQINVTKPNGTTSTVSYTVPELTTDLEYDAADAARATNQVALELAGRINGGGTHDVNIPNPAYDPTADICYNEYDYNYISSGSCEGYYDQVANASYDPTADRCQPYVTTYAGISGVTAVNLGSTVAVYLDDESDWLQVEVESGQGDRTTIAINESVEDTDGLPLYAVVGTRIKVQPDPTSDSGVYYLQAERIASNASGEVLEEVVWVESRSPDEKHSLDTSTMPHIIQYDGTNFTIGEVNYKERQSGDDDSVAVPSFVGKKITTLGYFQKRLAFVSENTINMTETDDLLNFWKQSAVTLLVTDPVEVSSSELASDVILHLIPHNRDMLVIASNSQFKITGTTAITPQTVSMTLTTKYDCQDSVSPVSIGNSVYFPIDYGDSTGVQEYTGEKNTSQDYARPITHQVIGYMEGNASLLAASPNLEMLVMTTDNTPLNEVFVYEQYTSISGKRTQQSWSRWKFADENEQIVSISFRRNALTLLVVKDGDLVLKEVEMYTRVTGSIEDVFLDDLLVLSTDGATCTVPTEYNTDDVIVVRGEDCDYKLNKVNFTRAGDTLTFEEDIGAGTVYVGKSFESSFTPTRPFKYDEDGSTITSDKLRISRFILSLVKTNQVFMEKTSQYSDDISDQEFLAQFVNRAELGEVTTFSGEWAFSFAEEADNAVARFYCSNYLGCTITDVSWEGQYYQSKRRM